MREIKFKWWDFAEKEMLSEYDLDNRIIESGEDGYFHFMKVARYHPLQYTGLKDKNGVEIYEGDLIEHEMEVNGLWEPYEACEVVFDAGCGIYCFKWDSPNLLTDYQNLTVIGNIYETPELLSTKK